MSNNIREAPSEWYSKSTKNDDVTLSNSTNKNVICHVFGETSSFNFGDMQESERPKYYKIEQSVEKNKEEIITPLSENVTIIVTRLEEGDPNQINKIMTRNTSHGGTFNVLPRHLEADESVSLTINDFNKQLIEKFGNYVKVPNSK